METPKQPNTIEQRILEGLARVGIAMRMDDWEAAKTTGLNPTQLAILSLLESRGPSGLGIKEIARGLGVTQPTATDSVNALEKKGCVSKAADVRDKRSVKVSITNNGRDLLAEIDGKVGVLDRSISSLSIKARTELLVTLVQLIQHLQQSENFPVQRMCVTCKYFGPFANADNTRPHQCYFVNAAFGQADLRIDCREQEPSSSARQAATWRRITGENPPSLTEGRD